MDEFRWINMFLFLILVLQCTVTVQYPRSFAAIVGVDVTLPCKNGIDYKDECKSTTWIFSQSVNTTRLFEHGILKDGTAISDRLSVTADCSLVVKKITVKDDGRYICRQFRSGQKHGEDTEYDLYVINTEDAKTTTIKPTTTRATTSKTTKPTTGNSTKAETNTTTSTKQVWWRFTIVAVGLAVLITTVVLIRWKRTKGNKTQMEENNDLTSNPAAPPETGQDSADPEDGVSYAVTYSTVKASSSSAGASADPSDLYATVNKLNK